MATKKSGSIWKDLHLWFLGFTSIGGLSQYRSNDLTVSKIFWLILFAAGLVLTMFNFLKVVQDILSYGVTISMTLEQQDSVPFPAVTLCNQNIVHCGNLHTVIGKSTPERMGDLCNVYKMGGCDISVSAAQSFFYGMQNKPNGICSNSSTTLPKHITTNTFLQVYSKLTEVEARAAAHQPDDMIKYCAFESHTEYPECQHFTSPENVTTFFSAQFGYCFTFNYQPPGQQKPKMALETTFPGPALGLDLKINIEEKFYLRNGLSETAGAKLVIHQTNSAPLLTSTGYDLMPGTQTDIGIRMVNISRQRPPYGSKCINFWNETSGMAKIYEDLTYDSQLCSVMCVHDWIYDACGCSLSTIAELSRINFTFCSEPDFPCIFQFTKTFFAHSNDSQETSSMCNCPLECETRQYLATISTAKWPSNNHLPYVANEYKMTFHNSTIDPHFAEMIEMNYTLELEFGGASAKIKKHIQDTLMRVKVFFESKSVQKIVETPTYGFSSIVADVGGAISVYLGLSMVSLFEIVDIFIHGFAYSQNSRKRAK